MKRETKYILVFMALCVALIVGVRVFVEKNVEYTSRGAWGEITVRYVNPPIVAADGDTLLGMWEPSERLILIDASLPGRRKRGVEAHELCHAALSDAGLTLPDSTEDAVCNAMELQAIARW